MKGKFCVIGIKGEKYYYKYYECAFKKYLKIYGFDTNVEHFDSHFITL